MDKFSLAEGFSLAFGAILYPVYRGLVYNWLMPLLQDKTRRKSNSYRTYLERQHGVRGKADATRLYVALRDCCLHDANRGADATIANVHLGYMAALILGSFSALSAITGRGHAVMWFLLTGVVFVGTFVFERRFQTDEHVRFLAGCEPDSIRAMAAKLDISVKAAGADVERRSDEGTHPPAQKTGGG